MTTLAKLALLASLVAATGCGTGSLQSASTDASADRGRHHVPPPADSSILSITNNRPHHRHWKFEVCPVTVVGTSDALVHTATIQVTLQSKTLDDGCAWAK